MKTQTGITLALAALALTLAGCGQQQNQATYVQGCNDDLMSLEPPARRLGEALGPWLKSETGDPATAEARLRELESAFDAASLNIERRRQAQIRGVEEFDAALNDYFAHQKKFIAELGTIVAEMKKNNPAAYPLVQGSWAKIDEFSAAEQKKLQELHRLSFEHTGR